MKKNCKKLAGALLALTMALSMMVVPAFAAGGVTEYDPGDSIEVTLTKNVYVPNGLPLTDEDFVFTITPGTELTDTTASSPAIGSNEITVAIASGDAATSAIPNHTLYANTALLNLDDLSGEAVGDVFPHAGIYLYTITEKAASSPTSNLNYSQASYTMYVYVTNEVDGDGNYTGNLIISAIGIYKDKDDGGNSTYTDEEKADAAFDYADYKSDLEFTNTYAKEATLEITKEVTGAYADTTKLFEYTLTLNVPTAEDDDEYTAYIDRTASGGTSGTITFTVSSGVATTTEDIKLAHGDKLVFDGANGSTKLPVGATYVLTEQAATDYIPSVAVGYNDGTDNHQTGTETAAAGDSLTIGNDSTDTLDTPINIEDGTNYANWTNEYKTVNPTGVLLDNLPFLLLILVAVGGFVGYVALKRRSVQR